MKVTTLVPHYTSEGRWVPEGTVIDVADKDLNVWQSPAEPAAKTAMDKKFTPVATPGQYKRGTL